MPISWENGYTANYYVTIIDPSTWKEGSSEQIKITGGTINRTMSDLRDSADLNCVRYPYTEEKLIRVWLDVKQEGSTSHTPLFTGLAVSPSRNINGRVEDNTIQCYSVLKYAQDILLPRGWYAPKGIPVEGVIRELLAPTHARVTIEPSEKNTLLQPLLALENENNLSMVDAILNAMKWRMVVQGDGNIFIGALDKRGVVDIFDSSMNDILETSININHDWYNCPNIFRAVSGNQVSIARDDSPSSPLSTVSRGREIWAEETNCDLNDGESLPQYAVRRLKELQTVATTASYTRRYKPGIYPSDFIRLNYPAQKLQGKFVITSHSITLGINAKTSEEVATI